MFHPALFASLVGQFLLHLATMMFAVKLSKAYMTEDELSAMRTAAIKGSLSIAAEETQESKFKPSVLNSVVFLLTQVQQVSVFAVNYKGRPWAKGLDENTGLLWSMAISVVLAFVLSVEALPMLNTYLELVPFPTAEFRWVMDGRSEKREDWSRDETRRDETSRRERERSLPTPFSRLL